VTNSGAADNQLKAFDLAQISASLDLLCITLPPEQPINIGGRPHQNPDRMRSVSLCSNLSFTEQQQQISNSSSMTSSTDNEAIMDNGIGESKLPTAQLEAWNTVMEDVKWMLRDEIAFALTKHTLKITETTLRTVADHILTSDGKPGCAVQTIPLHFVYGHETSLDLFLKAFEEIKIDGWRMVKEGDFAYFLHDPEGVEGVEGVEEAFTGAPLLCGKARQQRFQLSPVKEAHNSISSTSELDSLASAATIQGQLPMEDEVFVWYDDPSEKKHRLRPQFWLILKIGLTTVQQFFQYREGQFEALLPWRQTQQLIANDVRSLCKRVNQSLLLNDLYETRQCNRLLEPESNEEAWLGHHHHQHHGHEGLRQQNEHDDNDEDDVTYLEANLNVRFRPGIFACPLIWETDIALHPRLKEPVGHNQSSRGLQAIRMVLNASSVSNRSNMFAYRDDCKNTFYFKVFEILGSGNSGLPSDGDNYVGSRSSSLSSSALGFDYSNAASDPALGGKRPDDRIELKVFGIEPAGPNIKNDLVAVLQHKLNEKLVDILSTLLQRNPMCKLSPEDVAFMKRPRSLPAQVLRLKLNTGVACYLEALQYFLRQNMVHQLATIPKYMSHRSDHHFQVGHLKSFVF
jgi:hypothetical protein